MNNTNDTAVRVPCKQCGARVLSSTATHTGGLCMPCFKKPQQELIEAQFEADSKDKDLLDCGRRWYESMISHHYKQKALKDFEERYIPLLAFFREQGLTRDPKFGTTIADWLNFELRRSHLTELGVLLFLTCEIGWLRGLGRGTKPTYMSRWAKQLRELRNQHPNL